MRLRRFVGADVATATRLVREHLGPEAVILATRAHPNGIEITAAVDAELVTRPLAATSAGAPAAIASGGVALTLGASADAARDRRAGAARAPRPSRRDRAHLAPLRDPSAALGAEARDLARRLVLGGFAPPLAEAVALRFDRERAAGVDARAALEAGVAATLLPVPPPPDARVTALVGPTGAGKTTTIAKLAAARRRAGETSLGLVMADTYRIGAGEQLGTYARLLGIPMRVARDGAELRDALRAFADCARVYVDTTGLSGDAGIAADVARLLAAAEEPLAVTAVMSATSHETALRLTWARVGPLAPASCVLTKVDEGASPAVCGWLAEQRVPLRWIGTGQRVPEDLIAASGGALTEILIAP